MLCFGLDFKFTNGFGLVIATNGEIVLEVHKYLGD
jgi:hypothetical protein